MRGSDIQQDSLFSTVSPESRVPKDYPLRLIRTMVDVAFSELDADFNAIYSDYGRDSILPEKLLRTQLLMAFYTIRSERQLMEQIDYNLLFRWFVGFSMNDRVWDNSTFTKNRDRLLEGNIARRFFARVLGQAERAGLLSREHFSVDGTMIEALASLSLSTYLGSSLLPLVMLPSENIRKFRFNLTAFYCWKSKGSPSPFCHGQNLVYIQLNQLNLHKSYGFYPFC